MAVLWCGGEDLDFQQGSLPSVSTNSAFFRSGYARCAVGLPAAGNAMKGNQFPGGAVTTAWMSFRMWCYGWGTSNKIGGFGQFSSYNGLFVGVASSNAHRIALYKFNGTTLTSLAAESGTSLIDQQLQRFDIQVTNYGATATVNVYVDGLLVITYSGDVTVSGMTGMDCTIFGPWGPNWVFVSEVVVADEDTRTFSLVTMAPNAAGGTDNWTGAYTNCNPVTINDASAVYTNTASELEEFNLLDLPSGTFGIKAVKISARAAISAGATADKIELGYGTNSSLSLGSAVSVTTAWACYERLDTQNPVTSAQWQQTEMNPLQLAMESSS